ncbi:lactose-specific PTS transporter subunit EIIC [Sporolactobacillus sp. Y61]|uniref:PTS system lactose-specific EIICB component n=1 Tax=Sporolactobacillus sp. Y61 TaxID=3160863 RepID=A0AAU8II81_9BACL
MKWLINQISRMKPFFEKVAANPYLSAIRDGFIANMPIILFSSLFLLVAYVPNIWGFYWSSQIEGILMKAYNFSMGLLSVFVAATTSKALTDSKNLKLPKTNQINTVSTMVAAEVGFFLVAVDPLKMGIDMSYMGTKGLICAFLVGFIVPNIYYVCIKNNVTIKMPPQVPQNISQVFKDLIPFAFSTVFFWLFDIVFRALANGNLAEWIINVLAPLFRAADGYLGLAIIYGAMAFFWYIGIHGPSIVEPAVTAIYLANVEANLHLFQQGEHAGNVLAQGTQYFVATLGGTGATLMITVLFAFFAKSVQLKAVGRAAIVPVSFGVNEPVLFGGPLILNPVFFIPFILTPILNVFLFKGFVDMFDMNGFIYNLPWTTPGPLGLILGTGFAGWAFILAPALLLLDAIIYWPFFKVYDSEKVAEEAKNADKEDDDSNLTINKAIHLNKEVNVLVLCAGGGTSGILANALNKVAKEENVPISATARAYGAHMDLIPDMDLVILAPQMESMKSNLQEVCDKYGIKLISTTGKQYIDLTRNATKSINFVLENVKKQDA